jgi:hypothetical protein
MAQLESVSVIPQEVIDDVINKVNLIITTLAPYVSSLSEEERKSIAKMSDKTVAFVGKVKDFMTTNPQFAPNFMDETVLMNAYGNYNSVNPLLQLTLQLSGNLSDTAMINGSAAYLSALQYYNFVKQADKNNVPGAKEVYDSLAQRFPSTRKNSASSKSA